MGNNMFNRIQRTHQNRKTSTAEIENTKAKWIKQKYQIIGRG